MRKLINIAVVSGLFVFTPYAQIKLDEGFESERKAPPIVIVGRDDAKVHGLSAIREAMIVALLPDSARKKVMLTSNTAQILSGVGRHGLWSNS